MKKLTYDFIKESFAQRGYKLITQNYINQSQKLEYICPNNHHHATEWAHFSRGTGCPFCVKKGRQTLEQIKQEFEARNYIVLSDRFENAKQKIQYRCPDGHIGATLVGNFRKGQGCPECAGRPHYTVERIAVEMKVHRYTLLSNEYKNKSQKLKCQCPEGHTIDITWDSFRQGARCAYCAGNARTNYEDICEILDKERYKILTEKELYKGVNHPVELMCPQGHQYATRINDFKQGKRCRTCYIELVLKAKGYKNQNWNPNLTDEERKRNQNRTNKPDQIKWRIQVFNRDQKRCQVCLLKTSKLQAHHLYSYADYPEMRTDVDNGITLCESCHTSFHQLYGYGKNSKEQFNEFVHQLTGESIDGTRTAAIISVKVHATLPSK